MNGLALSTRAPLLFRAAALAFLFSCEAILLSVWLDNAALAGGDGIAYAIYRSGAVAVRSVIGFATLFALFTYLTRQPLLEELSAEAGSAISVALLAVHFALMAAFAILSSLLYTDDTGNLVAGAWLLTGCAAIVTAALSLLPYPLWKRLARGTVSVSLGSAAVVAAIVAGGEALRSLWQPASLLTLTLAQFMLHPLLPGLHIDSDQRLIGTDAFYVQIAPQCSGLEGIALILGFITLWLIVFRKECRFPNAFVMLPVGVAIMFLMNAVRIAALILLGNAGARQIALGGFHSQVGWITFILVALATTVAAHRIPWLIAIRPGTRSSRSSHTAAYLAPLITSLAFGMATTAASNGLDTLCLLGFLSTATVLWGYQRKYASMDWHWSWPAPLTGLAVLVLWILFDPRDPNALNNALPAASLLQKNLWIIGRVLTTVITVPLAEELAFRGYLLRRLVSAEFETVSMKQRHWLAIFGSSALFGLLHGEQWLAGMLAGLLYGLITQRKGRIGEAVVAHMTTNALLAAYVIAFRRWHLW